MTRNHSCHLLIMLAEVSDPRNKKGQRHPLAAMLALTVVGLLCGQRSYTAIAKWARLHPELRQVLGFTAKQTPAASTFHYLFRRLDITAVEKVLTEWITQTLARLDISTDDLIGLAIDGKTLGNSHAEDARRIHFLAAVLHELGIPIAECAVSEKTNEIPVSLELLKAFDVKGFVITTDALLTQRKFCQQILDRQADYCLPSKRIRNSCMKIFETSLNPLMKQTHLKSTNAALKTFTQKTAHIFKRPQTQKTQKAG